MAAPAYDQLPRRQRPMSPLNPAITARSQGFGWPLGVSNWNTPKVTESNSIEAWICPIECFCDVAPQLPGFQSTIDPFVSKHQDQQIVPGISLSPSGQATVDPALTNVLIDIAIKIDDMSKFPVDVEHVLAAIVLAARSGTIETDMDISSDSDALISALAEHVETVFERFGGKVGLDD